MKYYSLSRNFFPRLLHRIGAFTPSPRENRRLHLAPAPRTASVIIPRPLFSDHSLFRVIFPLSKISYLSRHQGTKTCGNLKDISQVYYYSAHRRSIHPLSLTRLVYSSSQIKTMNENEDEATFKIFMLTLSLIRMKFQMLFLLLWGLNTRTNWVVLLTIIASSTPPIYN